jgi:hypothetical protein
VPLPDQTPIDNPWQVARLPFRRPPVQMLGRSNHGRIGLRSRGAPAFAGLDGISAPSPGTTDWPARL